MRTAPTFNPGVASQVVNARVRDTSTYRTLLETALVFAATAWKECPTVELARAAGGRTGVVQRAIEAAIASVGVAAHQELGSKMFPATPASVLRGDAHLVRSATEGK